jgi:phytoene synthase
MKEKFDSVSAKCSRLTTLNYSTSFSLGILFLTKQFHKPIYGIYGFVRFADEIVDSFQGYDKEKLIAKFRADTLEAIEDRISLNPILNSFQHVVHEYNIEWELIDTFLKSMEMDLSLQSCDVREFDKYILGSAEVVGLMCLRVFVEGNQLNYDLLKESARRLGSAFQKVNFLRDLKHDYELLGRSYFPGVDLNEFNEKSKKQIEQEIEADFKEALEGIKRLPKGARRGVYLAYVYYYELFSKIRRVTPNKLMSTRVRIANNNKLLLMVNSMLRYQLNYL